ncbi:MAG: methyltransferase domain-containing protein [Deltaproteobacteria bacterium]|nr:methyltransferase domain-containing protein [Deltaproteobacteria bacterium]
MNRLPRMKRYSIRWSFALMIILAVIGLFVATQKRLMIDPDIINAIPDNDPVIADARYVISNHPLQDRIIIDISCRPHDINRLMTGASVVEQRLRRSGLFHQVGREETFHLYPELVTVVAHHLPVMFSETELKEHIAPLLDFHNVRTTLRTQFHQLQSLEGIGQGELISLDPLGFRNIVLARLAPLAPGKGIKVQSGRLISDDGRHILLTAEPATPDASSSFARQATQLFAEISEDLKRQYEADGTTFTVTPVGAYRAALDNETTAKQDTRRAVLFSTVVILLLLLIGFPRPFIGILALPPALAGTITALFVYSLVKPSISILAVGFGGAIISFTVDYGIAYFLFLDRPYDTTGPDASREVWFLGLLAMLTTVVSFAFLCLSGFPALTQLGIFAALGVLFTFIFVHAVYPFVFPKIPSARREGYSFFRKAVKAITASQNPAKAWAALILFVVMLFFAKPVFHADLNAMNALSPETKAAEKLIGKVWGNMMSRIYIVIEGKSLDSLREKGDNLAALIENAMTKDIISSAFLPPMVFPGPERTVRNFSAWNDFWTPELVAEMEENLSAAARDTGFAKDAFTPFLSLLRTGEAKAPEIPPALFPLMGIAESRAGESWHMSATLTAGVQYRAEHFVERLSGRKLAKVFDPVFFGQRLSAIIMDGFIKVALIVGLLTVVVAFLFLLDIPLTLTAVAPTVFAMVCTLGTLNLLGIPLGIPVIMMSAVVIGMGTDYALYLVVSWQRYMNENHPSLLLIRTSIFLSFATTFLGFGILSLGTHVMLKNIGLTLLLGIGYSFLGAITIVPTIAGRLFAPQTWPHGHIKAGSKKHTQSVLKRYRHMAPYTRLFARFKIYLDPMFPQLAQFVKMPRMILDIGCGYGVPAAWLLAVHPEARVFGIDPDRRRVYDTAHAIGNRGVVLVGKAPDIPKIPKPADTVLLLDIIHMLSDEDLQLTLKRIRNRMRPAGQSVLILRCTLPMKERSSFERRLEHTRLLRKGVKPSFRSAGEIAYALSQAGFRVVLNEPSSPDKELYWFIAEPIDKEIALHALP